MTANSALILKNLEKTDKFSSQHFLIIRTQKLPEV